MVGNMRITAVVILGLLLLEIEPSWAFRLQNGKSSSAKADNLKQVKSSSSKGSENEVSLAWPPRVPMWGFLPPQQESEPLTSGGSKVKSPPTKSDLESFEVLEQSPLSFLPSSLSSSSFSKSKKSGIYHSSGGVHSEINHLHHPPLSIEGPLPEDTEEEEEGEEPWIANLKRSTGVSRASGGVKRTRNYDVPQIDCPPADDGMERFSCPTPDNLGRYRCVDDHVLCDGFVDCPGREDEDRQACMFYKTTKAHLDVLADALLRWARGR